MNLPQLQRIYLEDYQNCTKPTTTMALIHLIASQQQQTVILAQALAKQRAILGTEILDFLETILVYKLPHLRP
jgi:hypothetical protein